MEKEKKTTLNLSLLAETFELELKGTCTHLKGWLSANYVLTATQKEIFAEVYQEICEDANYWNEEELKMKAVALLFFLADVKVKNKVKVFYERPLSAKLRNHELKVVTDCMVATPMAFNTPTKPYFFLQEFKKGRGETKDPEAQMLTAMLIAQELNKDNQPIYGGFLIGGNWYFATLVEKAYCTSRLYNATHEEDLLQIVYILRKLKDLILHRT
jgi:hypothetical protein